MMERDFSEYFKIVGENSQESYLGPERQGELLRRCTILDDIEIGYSSNTNLKKEKIAN